MYYGKYLKINLNYNILIQVKMMSIYITDYFSVLKYIYKLEMFLFVVKTFVMAFFERNNIQSDLYFSSFFIVNLWIATQTATGSLHDKSRPFFRIHEKGLVNTKDVKREGHEPFPRTLHFPHWFAFVDAPRMPT